MQKLTYQTNSERLKLSTILLHILAWSIFFAIPVIFSPQSINVYLRKSENLQLTPLFVTELILVIVFYANYLVFIPAYLLKRKYLLYFLTCLASITIVFGAQTLMKHPSHKHGKPHFEGAHRHEHDRPGTGHPKMHEVGQPNFEGPNSEHRKPPHKEPKIHGQSPMVMSNTLLMFFVTLLAAIGLRLNYRWKQTEEEKLSAQLSYLKTQMNPHFLFNTLNSIYSVTISKAPQGAEMIGKLSEMMRYTLKETQMDFVLLEKEVNYITNFIDMQKVRFDESVILNYNVIGLTDDLEIAPLLLIPFVENAFKHGVNSEEDSNIEIQIRIENGQISLEVNNHKVKHDVAERSGLGIETTRKRLDLIYPNTHQLKITDAEKYFHVSLQIQLL